jgi:hypothetical protein
MTPSQRKREARRRPASQAEVTRRAVVGDLCEEREYSNVKWYSKDRVVGIFHAVWFWLDIRCLVDAKHHVCIQVTDAGEQKYLKV